jgi:sec-independent protein translocase protein TatA
MSVMLFSLPGGMEWVIILVAILLLFGGKKIPELMRGLGKGIREFNSAKANVKEEIEKGMTEEEEEKKTSKKSDSEDDSKS